MPPTGGLERIPEDERAFSGTALEVLAAGSYTYLRIRTDPAKERWAVIVGDGVVVGDYVVLDGFGRRTNFYSKQLRREFAEVTFAALHE